MTSTKQLAQQIKCGQYDKALQNLYGEKRLAEQRARYYAAVQGFLRYFGNAPDVRLYSVPGRTELCGNHTDYQGGTALAAAVDLDIIAVAAKRQNRIVRVKSYGFDKLDVIDLGVTGPQLEEGTHSASLIRGIGWAMQQHGGVVGGFDAYTTSDVLRGSGLSSSAAFETMMGTILNDLYNDGAFSALEVAQIGQYAENAYFGKPSGLLDPLACAMGGVLCVDFQDELHPEIHQCESDLWAARYALCITDTRGSHSEMAEEFARVRQEMEQVARQLGAVSLRAANEADFWREIPALRKTCGDRAVLRAAHFYKESSRARQAFDCLTKSDVQGYLACTAASGHSAVQYVQNAYSCTQPARQELVIALAVSEAVLNGTGAYRLQGTGFAGTIQAFVPREKLAEYQSAMESVFGAGCCYIMQVRTQGAVKIT